MSSAWRVARLQGLYMYTELPIACHTAVSDPLLSVQPHRNRPAETFGSDWTEIEFWIGPSLVRGPTRGANQRRNSPGDLKASAQAALGPVIAGTDTHGYSLRPPGLDFDHNPTGLLAETGRDLSYDRVVVSL